MGRTREDEKAPLTEVRLDLWLDVACLFPTRSQAAAACAGGKVDLNGRAAAAHKLVRAGDRLEITFPRGRQTFLVKGLAERHVPKVAARALYEETTPPLAPEVLEARRLERLWRRGTPAAGARRRRSGGSGRGRAGGEAPPAPAVLRDPAARRLRGGRPAPAAPRAPRTRRRPDAARHARVRRVRGARPPRRDPPPRPPRGAPGPAARGRAPARAPEAAVARRPRPLPRGDGAHLVRLQLAEARASPAPARRPLRPGPVQPRDRPPLRREPRAPPPGPVPISGALEGARRLLRGLHLYGDRGRRLVRRDALDPGPRALRGGLHAPVGPGVVVLPRGPVPGAVLRPQGRLHGRPRVDAIAVGDDGPPVRSLRAGPLVPPPARGHGPLAVPRRRRDAVAPRRGAGVPHAVRAQTLAGALSPLRRPAGRHVLHRGRERLALRDRRLRRPPPRLGRVRGREPERPFRVTSHRCGSSFSRARAGSARRPWRRRRA